MSQYDVTSDDSSRDDANDEMIGVTGEPDVTDEAGTVVNHSRLEEAEESADALPDDAEAARVEMEADPLTRDIEAVLFISPEPVSLEVLAEVTGVEGDELTLAVESVRDKFSEAGGGIVFTELAGGYTFRSHDRSLPSVERFCQRPADYTLSAAAIETLAIVAYLQPITRPEISRIRGIGADTVVANLLDKGLLEESGRARDTGAVKYRTSRTFEKLFGLADISGLPAIESFDATPQDVEELRQKLHLAADKRQ